MSHPKFIVRASVPMSRISRPTHDHEPLPRMKPMRISASSGALTSLNSRPRPSDFHFAKPSRTAFFCASSPFQVTNCVLPSASVMVSPSLALSKK